MRILNDMQGISEGEPAWKLVSEPRDLQETYLPVLVA